MAQKNETPVLFLSLLISIALLGGIAWWVFKSYDLSKLISSTSTPKNSTSQSESKLANDSSSSSLNSTRGVDYTYSASGY